MFYQETLFIGTPEDTYEALETGIFISTGAPLVTHLPGTLKDRWRTQEMERVSLSMGVLQGAKLRKLEGVCLPDTFSDSKRALLK